MTDDAIRHLIKESAMDLIQAMRIFSKLADTESFTKAAEQLDLAVPVVTRNIASLERHLNARLLNRTTRRVSLTPLGQTYLDGCRSALEQVDKAELSVAQISSETSGLLRILAGTPFSLSRLGPLFTRFQQRFPNIHLQLTLSDREIDFVEEGVDAAILADYMVGSGTLIARPLFKYTYALVATAAHQPNTPEELKQLCFIGRPADSRGHALRLQPSETGPAVAEVTLFPSLVCNNAMMLHELARQGMGFAILPTVFVEEDIRTGKLVRLLPDWEIDGNYVDVCLVYPSRKFIPRRLQAFIDHVVEEFSG